MLYKLYPYTTTDELIQYFPKRTKNSVLVMARSVLKLEKDKDYLDRQWEELRLSDNEMIQKLKEYAEEIGRTPFQADLDNNELMPSSTSYRRHFGTYTEACRLAGLEPNFNIYGERIQTYLSKNNDICFSKSELIITNFFIDKELIYTKEFLYKHLVDDPRCGLKRIDWLLNDDIVVEFFGMPEKDFYRKKMEEKISICNDNNIQLIELYPEDLINNLEGVRYKLNKYIN